MGMEIIKRFSGLVLGVYFLLSFSSCQERWDDPIPEGAELGTPFLRADLNEDGSIFLQWDISRICPGFNCVPWVEGSNYDVFIRRQGQENFEKLVNLAQGTNEFLFGDSQNGKVHEFFIRSNRAGRETISNTIMIVPGVTPEKELIFRSEDNWNNISYPKVSPNGNQVAYISQVRFTVGGQDFGSLGLFIWDNNLKKQRMIKMNVNYPNWSSDGSKLIYTTSDGLRQISPGNTPVHLEIFDVEKEEFSLFSGGLHRYFLPSFGKGDQKVYFISDSLGMNDYGLWKRPVSGISEPILTSINNPDVISGMAPFRGLNASKLSEMVAIDKLQFINGRPVYNIIGFDMSRGGQKVDLMVSQWNDSNPSFSPFDEHLMAFLSDRSGSSQIWILNVHSGALQQVTFFNDDIFVNQFGFTVSWTDHGEALVIPIGRPNGIRELVKLRLLK